MHAHPLRLNPGLAHFGGWGGARVLCASVQLKGACSQGPEGQALSLEVGALEEGICPHEVLMTCESSKAWQEIVF